MREVYENIQENGQDIDTTIHCECGTSFYMYVPYCPYSCPTCQTLYEAKVVIERISEDEKERNFVLVGSKAE